jgi:hypothetical protein
LAKKRTRRKGETLLGFLILALLAIIAVIVFFQQFQFNPAVTAQSALEEGKEHSVSAQFSTLVPLPENLRQMTPLESFTPETLYEKIDGQADLYLASGFRQLECQRYVQTDNQDMWFEVFKYDMGTIENAFSVYSQQYRDDGHPLEWTEFAYSVANALFFVHGRDYIEMRAASTSDELVASMHDVAKRYVETHPLEKATIAGLSWFPKEDLDTKSMAMVVSNAFGFEGLNQVFTAEYRIDGITVTGYMSQCASAREAAELASAFQDYFLRFGGQELEAGFPSPSGKTIEIMDTTNIIFSDGPYLAGVHEALNIEVARELASRLHKQIGVMIGEQSAKP